MDIVENNYNNIAVEWGFKDTEEENTVLSNAYVPFY